MLAGGYSETCNPSLVIAAATAGMKRRLGSDAPVIARATNAERATQEAFNDSYLKYYYRHLFPYNAMFRWFAYGNGTWRAHNWNRCYCG